MSEPVDRHPTWAPADSRPFATIARNVSTRYLSNLIELAIGLVMLPFNLHHLGPQAYGLWMLTAGVTIHFSVLDLGYGSATVKFIAQYRAQRDGRALNEIASTMFFLFAAIGIVAYAVIALLAFNLNHVFRITPEQAEVGRWILLLVGVNIALNFPFSVFGGITDGFQRYDVNNAVAIVFNLLIAAVNAAMLWMGYGLVPLVAAMTAMRVGEYLGYRRNAYRVFRPLRIGLEYVRRARLREVTGFSVYSAIIDWANKLNYEVDELVIGAFLGSGPVAVWVVADRIISGAQRMTNQINGVLFPFIVDSDTTNRHERLQKVLLEGTRISVATALPLSVALFLLARPLVRAWVGPAMMASAPIIQVLAVVLALRVGNATGTTLLKGAGRVRYLAVANIVAGLANVALSAALVRPFGLVGVAIGTLIPVACNTIFVLFPAACRRVELPIGRALRFAIWPAVWPAVVAGGTLMVVELTAPDTLLMIFAEGAMAALLYYALFALAIGRRDRTEYRTKLLELVGWRAGLAPVA